MARAIHAEWDDDSPLLTSIITASMLRPQPEAIHGPAQLAGALTLVAEAPPASDLLAGWSDRFEQALIQRSSSASGRPEPGRSAVRRTLMSALQSREASIERIFFDGAAAAIPVERYLRRRSAR